MQIITHNGRFHTDEVFASSILRILYPDIEILRTRDEKIIGDHINDKETIIIDVGKKYLPEKLMFDHHQEDFTTRFKYYCNIKMSSCGLIWKHYGEDVIKKIISDKESDLNEKSIEKIHERIYKTIILPIDANDNGVKQIINEKKVEYNFYNEITIYNIVSSFNSSTTDDDRLQMIGFIKVMDICEDYFRNVLNSFVQNEIDYHKYLPIFREIYNSNKNKEYLYIENEDINYRNYINKFDPEKNIKLIITKDKFKNKPFYSLRTRRKYNYGFDIVLPLISGKEVGELFDVKEKIFIHNNKFLGRFETYELAQKVAEESIRRNTWYYYIKSVIPFGRYF